MTKVHQFTFGPFQENTYLISANDQCIIIDPGCYNTEEWDTLIQFMESHNLEPVMLLNTHFHIDHVMGNKRIFDHFGLTPIGHEADLPTLDMAAKSAELYGLNYSESPQPEAFLEHGEVFTFGGEDFEVRWVPGHAPGHVVFVNHENKYVINGDVLFYGSIGRTDLPGGNHDQLLESIKREMYSLPDDYKVYTGHGPETTIGFEKDHNPFVRGE